MSRVNLKLLRQSDPDSAEKSILFDLIMYQIHGWATTLATGVFMVLGVLVDGRFVGAALLVFVWGALVAQGERVVEKRLHEYLEKKVGSP